MAGCDGWITFKILELLFTTFCMIYKRVTDDEANKLFYFLQKYSREWPLLNSITWEENGAIFTDITYGGYIILVIGLIIGQCSGELQRCKKTENFFLITGALLFLAAGSLELAALESVEERLVDNAAILGIFSLLTGFLFIIDFLCASKRRKKEKLQIIQKHTQSKLTQTEENKPLELIKLGYQNGSIQNKKVHPDTDIQNGSRMPRNAVKLLPSSLGLGNNTLTPLTNGNKEYLDGALYLSELPVIDGSELKTHEGRVKSTESFLRSEKGFYPKLRRTLETDYFNNNFCIPDGYILVPSEHLQDKSKPKSDSGVGDSPTPPGYAKIIPDAKGKPGYVIIPIDQKDISRKVQSLAVSKALRDSSEFCYLEQVGKSKTPSLYRSASFINYSDLSDLEEPIKQQFQKVSSKYVETNPKRQKFAPMPGDSSDEQNLDYLNETHFRPESRHSIKSQQDSKAWRQDPKGKVNEGYLNDKENDLSFASSSPYRSRAPSPEKPKSILRCDNNRSLKKETGLYLPMNPHYDSLDSEKIAKELKSLKEITKSDLEIEKENKFLKQRLKLEKKEKEKLKYKLEDRKNQLYESEEEKNRRISEREEQYFGIGDLKQNVKEPENSIITQLQEAQILRKGAKEVNKKLKQKYLEHENKAAKEAQEFRNLIDERFFFLHEEDEKRKNLFSRREAAEKSRISEVPHTPDLANQSKSSKLQKLDEFNSSQSTDEEIQLRVETPGNASYKSEALFWLGSDRESLTKSNTHTSPGSPGYVLYTAQNWPNAPSPEDRFGFSAKEAQQLTLATPPKTPVLGQTAPEFKEKKNSQTLHLLEFEKVPESPEKSENLRKGLLVRKVDFPKEAFTNVKKPTIVQGSTSTWRRWLYPKPKLQHTRSVPN